MTLSDNRITVAVDARSANKTYFDQLAQLLGKTKLDLEFLLLTTGGADTASLNDALQKGKAVVQVTDGKQPLNTQLSELLSKATGATAAVWYTPFAQPGNLLQSLFTQRKLAVEGKLLAGVHTKQQKGAKSAIPFSEKLANSLMRMLTPIQLSDANSDVLFGKTETLKAVLGSTLSGANSYLQTLNVAFEEKVAVEELPLPGDFRTPFSPLTALASSVTLRLHYFLSDALQQLRKTPKTWADTNHPGYRLLYFLFFVVVAFAMPILSQDFGSTWDEKAHNDYAQLAYNYLTTFGADTAAIAESQNASDYIRQAYRFYGEQMNTVAAFVYNWFGTGVYETRHMVNSFYGLIGIIFTSLLAFELAGWRAALMALLFMFMNPGWMGHSMNNPTDIPFATGFAFAGYYMVRVMRSLPKPTYRDLFWLAVGLGIGLASRVGAFLIVAYLGLFLGVNWLDKVRRKEPNTGKLIMPYAKILLVVVVIGYLLGIAIWPYALDNPLVHPYKAFKMASENAFYTNNVELFEGKRMYMLTAAPWYYVFKFLGMGNPLYLLAGVALGILLVRPLSKMMGLGSWAMLVFMLFFPIVYAEISNLNYYNGWRHYLFVLPFAVALAAAGWEFLLRQVRPIAIGAAVVLIVLFLNTGAWVVKNHPNQYVYFNELAGGTKGAYGHYETDYYSNSCRAAAEWIAQQHPNDTLTIGINNEITTAAYWAHQINPNLKFVWTRDYEEQKQPWDYLILTTRTFSSNELLNGSFPPKGTVHTIDADGIPLAAIVKRENNYMPLGYTSLDKQQFDSSVFYFTRAVEYAPKDEEAWRMLGFSLINKSRMDSAEMMLKKSIEIFPENFSAYSNLGIVYFNKKEYQKAIQAFKTSTDYKENVPESWYYSALAYLNLNDYTNAIRCLEMAVKHNASIPEVYYYLAKSYDMTGSWQKAADNYQIALSLNQNMMPAWGELGAVFRKLNKPQEAAYCEDKYRQLGGR